MNLTRLGAQSKADISVTDATTSVLPHPPPTAASNTLKEVSPYNLLILAATTNATTSSALFLFFLKCFWSDLGDNF